MDENQLEAELKQNEIEYGEAKKAIIRKYIHLNDPYKIGDIIQDHYHTIKVVSKKCALNNRCAVYFGVELKKNLEPTKGQHDTRMWQTNVERKIEE